jgi:hypothetical protein
MTHYFDSSAAVKIYLQETGSDWVETVCLQNSEGEIGISQIAGAEVVAAINRRHRTGDIDAATLGTALDAFESDFSHFFVRIPVSLAIIRQAMRLLRQHPLRGYDAVQLATALEWADRLASFGLAKPIFVGADNLLNQAAIQEGLQTENPNTHS